LQTREYKLLNELLTGSLEDSQTISRDDLWYPDESNNWIEVPENVMSYRQLGLRKEDITFILFKNERDAQKYVVQSNTASNRVWDKEPSDPQRIVAYKLSDDA